MRKWKNFNSIFDSQGRKILIKMRINLKKEKRKSIMIFEISNPIYTKIN